MTPRPDMYGAVAAQLGEQTPRRPEGSFGSFYEALAAQRDASLEWATKNPAGFAAMTRGQQEMLGSWALYRQRLAERVPGSGRDAALTAEAIIDESGRAA